jgi:hypothetical protein
MSFLYSMRGVAIAMVAIAAISVSHFSLTAAEQEGGIQQVARIVDPSIVTIDVADRGQGSGFLLASTGYIVTNYHVIEGGKKITVVMHDKAKFNADGYIAISPGKDLAVLSVKLPSGKYAGLSLLEADPSKGDVVLAFGSPMGLSGSVTNGIVSAMRTGTEVKDNLKKLAGRDIYTGELKYDLDAHWIQTTAPISPGNSGGPLVSAEGKVVGINTWEQPIGQNLNFAISAVHISELLKTGGSSVHLFSQLPPPRTRTDISKKGQPDKTLAYWKSLAKNNTEGEKKREETAKKMTKTSSMIKKLPDTPNKAQINKVASADARDKAEYGNALIDEAKKIRAISIEGVDEKLVKIALSEASLLEATGSFIRVNDNLNDASFIVMIVQLGEISSQFDVYHLSLSKTYGIAFPSFDEVAAEEKKAEASEAQKKRAESVLVMAKTFIKNGEKDSADKFLKRVVAEFPDTPAAEEAKTLLEKQK